MYVNAVNASGDRARLATALDKATFLTAFPRDSTFEEFGERKPS
jgi:hypothetical protein